MIVKNISARLHHIGNISIAPGEEKELPTGFDNAINKDDLVEVKKVGRPSKQSANNETQNAE
jgi:hypothetical protein